MRVQSETIIEPLLMPFFVCTGNHKKFDLHLLEFTSPKREVARRDLVPERLSDLRDPERKLEPHRLQHVIEIDENSLRGFRPEVSHRRLVLEGTHECLEHQIELPRFGELAFAARRTKRS